MHVILRNATLLLALAVVASCSDSNTSFGGTGNPPTGFMATNLISDQPGVAANTDPLLVNAWGLAMDSQSFWVANNASGHILVVAPDGSPSKFSPPVSALNTGPGITGVVANTTNEFQIGTTSNLAPATAIVASENGQIFGINAAISPTPQLVVDRGNAGAVYKGLAIYTASDGSVRLAVADFHNNRIDIFDGKFSLIATATVVDPDLRPGLAPFNVMAVGSSLYVSYAVQDATGTDDVPGVGNGRIDVYDVDGNFAETLLDGGRLNAPWGMAIAPSSFGSGLAGKLIVGNFGDGTLLALNPTTGVGGALLMPDATPLVIDGLWGLAFGNGQVGATSSLYFTAGPQDEMHGLFGRIDFGTTPPM